MSIDDRIGTPIYRITSQVVPRHVASLSNWRIKRSVTDQVVFSLQPPMIIANRREHSLQLKAFLTGLKCLSSMFTHGTGIFNSNTRFVALTVRLSGCVIRRIHEVRGLETWIVQHGNRSF